MCFPHSGQLEHPIQIQPRSKHAMYNYFTHPAHKWLSQHKYQSEECSVCALLSHVAQKNLLQARMARFHLTEASLNEDAVKIRSVGSSG